MSGLLGREQPLAAVYDLANTLTGIYRNRGYVLRPWWCRSASKNRLTTSRGARQSSWPAAMLLDAIHSRTAVQAEPVQGADGGGFARAAVIAEGTSRLVPCCTSKAAPRVCTFDGASTVSTNHHSHTARSRVMSSSM